MAAYQFEAGASNYQTNPHPARHSEVRTDRARLEKLSIVRTLPNAPDLYLRFRAGGSVCCLSRRFRGKACAGSQESLNQRIRWLPQDKLKDQLPRKLTNGFPHGG
jgi:hypothetical protein